MPSSFKRIHYALRPAKNVERKLIVECLRALEPAFPIPTYRYVGLGAINFSDFILVHRLLRIRKMLSIEKEAKDAKRAAFNAPYNCIEVIPGESTVVLPEIGLGEQPTILWLDYDSDLRGPVLEDLGIVADSLTVSSVFVVTVNAVANQLHEPVPGRPGEVRDRRDVLAELTGRAPETIPRSATDRTGFPAFFADFLFDRFQSLVEDASGGAWSFSPLFNYSYADGAQMVTVGGMVTDRAAEARLSGCELPDFATGRTQYTISIPLLTNREKIELERMFPCDPWPSVADVEAIGLPLEADELEGFWRFYRQYPAFGEFVA